MLRTLTIAGLLALSGCAAGGQPAPAPGPSAAGGDAFYGKQVAERSCGGCHAVSRGPSPMADAPAFIDLHRRYPAGGLAQLLQEGMVLPSDRIQDEGSRYTHPRMPAVQLGSDEIAALTAYLRSLETAP